MMKSALILTFFLLFYRCSLATTYYIDNAGGNDGNSGTSESAAWNSISKVNSYGFNSGDVISLKCGGRFTGTTLTNLNNITINSYGTGARPIIDGESSRVCANFSSNSNVTFNGIDIENGYPRCVVLTSCDHFTFESCNINHSKGGSYIFANIYSGMGSHLTIRNSTISFGQQTDANDGNLGIYIEQTQNTLLEYDTLDGNHSNIRLAFGTDGHDFLRGLIVRYCVVKNGRYDNVDDDGSMDAQFYYNVFETPDNNEYHDNIYIFSDGSGSYGNFTSMGAKYYNNTFIQHKNGCIIDMSPDKQIVSDGLTLKNNIFYYDSPSGYIIYHPWGSPTKQFNIDNNIIYATASYFWEVNGNKTSDFATWKSWGYDANGKFADPMFTNKNSGDYSLQSGSPAINAGTDVGLTKDIKGNPVPVNSPDIGAYQHNTGGKEATGTESPNSSTSNTPATFAIGQNYPNPFNPSTKIDYQVPSDARVILEVYNISGQKVAELVNEDQSAGFYSISFGATSKLSSGIYIYRMTASDRATGKSFVESRKMMLLK